MTINVTITGDPQPPVPQTDRDRPSAIALPTAGPDRPSPWGVVAVVTAFTILSLGSTLAKSSGAPGPVVAFWRFLIGASVWHVVIAARGRRRRTARLVGPQAWRLATLPGIAFGVNLSLFFSGASRTPIAHAEFISALAPIVLVPLAAQRLHERVPRHVVVSGGAAITGVTLILTGSGSADTSIAGDTMVVGAMLAWVAYLLLAKSARAELATADFMAVMTTAAAVTSLPFAIATAGGPADLIGLPAKAWLIVVALAVSSGVAAHGLITWSQRRVPVATISMLQLGQPALGVLWAATLLGESVQPVQMAGMAVVLTAVGTIAWRTVHPRPV